MAPTRAARSALGRTARVGRVGAVGGWGLDHGGRDGDLAVVALHGPATVPVAARPLLGSVLVPLRAVSLPPSLTPSLTAPFTAAVVTTTTLAAVVRGLAVPPSRGLPGLAEVLELLRVEAGAGLL